MDDKFSRANEIFSAGQTIQQEVAAEARLGAHDLYQYLTQTGFELSSDQLALLFRSPLLREGLAAMRARLAAHHFPAVAAASGGETAERPFAGGRLSVIPATEGSHVYLVVNFESPTHLGDYLLVVSAAKHPLIKHRVRIEEERRLFAVLDEADAQERALLEALRDPKSEGDLIALAPDATAP